MHLEASFYCFHFFRVVVANVSIGSIIVFQIPTFFQLPVYHRHKVVSCYSYSIYVQFKSNIFTKIIISFTTRFDLKFSFFDIYYSFRSNPFLVSCQIYQLSIYYSYILIYIRITINRNLNRIYFYRHTYRVITSPLFLFRSSIFTV